MATITKTQGTSVLALQELTSGARQAISSALSVTTALAATIFVRIGRLTATAFTAGVNIRIEASAKSSGDGFWFPLTQFTTALGSSVADEAVNGTCNSGQAVVGMASTTGFAVGDIVYIDQGAPGNSEFGRVAVVTTNTSVTLEDNLVNAQTGSTVYDQAEMFVAQIDCTAIGRLRVVVDGSGAGQNFACDAWAVTGDSIG